jgi:predicted metal-dependent hydrolase
LIPAKPRGDVVETSSTLVWLCSRGKELSVSSPMVIGVSQQRQPPQPTDPAPRIEVRRSPRRRRTVSAYRQGESIVVLVPQALSAAEERRLVAQLVGRVLARERRGPAHTDDSELAQRAAELADRHLAPTLGAAPRPRSVRWVSNQNSRWGSCTVGTGDIQLSHRLQQMPSWVIDYVLLHELTHLVEPNHSARFWSLVSAFPDAARARGYLEGFSAGQGRPSADAD